MHCNAFQEENNAKGAKTHKKDSEIQKPSACSCNRISFSALRKSKKLVTKLKSFLDKSQFSREKVNLGGKLTNCSMLSGDSRPHNCWKRNLLKRLRTISFSPWLKMTSELHVDRCMLMTEQPQSRFDSKRLTYITRRTADFAALCWTVISPIWKRKKCNTIKMEARNVLSVLIVE